MGPPDKLVPVQCPISASVLFNADSRVTEAFDSLNDARRSGSLGALKKLRADLESWVCGPAEKTLEGQLRLECARNAALGDCLTLIGRWTGDLECMKRGLLLIHEFVQGESSSKLNDGGATHLRAQAYLGNAISRLGYITHDPTTLQRATDYLDHAEKRESWRTFLPLLAFIQQNQGDTLVGRLHWDKKATIDGAAIEALEAAVVIFAGEWKSLKIFPPTDERLLLFDDEWVGSMSSLAVANTRTAWALIEDKFKVDDCYLTDLTSTKEAAKQRKKDGALKLRKKKAEELLEESEKQMDFVWKAYLRRMESQNKPCFRWVRTLSNLAFASSYAYEMGKKHFQGRWGACASLSETAFRIVLNIQENEFPRVFKTGSNDPWHEYHSQGDKHYDPADHSYRYIVNEKGLFDLCQAGKK